MTTPPTFEQVRSLPCALERTVPAHFADANGHMNIARYLELYNEAAWTAMAAVGLGEADAVAGRAASMAIEQHLRYLREVHVGDLLSCHLRLIGRSSKAVHHFLTTSSNCSTRGSRSMRRCPGKLRCRVPSLPGEHRRTQRPVTTAPLPRVTIGLAQSRGSGVTQGGCPREA